MYSYLEWNKISADFYSRFVEKVFVNCSIFFYKP